MARRVAVLSVVLGLSGCSSVDDAAPPRADAGTRPVTLIPTRPAACGGEVAGQGAGPGGPLAASYIFVERCDGDCTPLVVTIAGGNSDASFAFFVRGGTTGTFLGTHDVTVRVSQPGQPQATLRATLEITGEEPPGLPTTFLAPAFGKVVGSFAIHDGDWNLTGTFASPVCQSSLAV